MVIMFGSDFRLLLFCWAAGPMTIRHFDFSFFLLFNPGDLYYLGYKNNNNNNNNNKLLCLERIKEESSNFLRNNSDLPDVHLTLSQRLRWSTLLWRHVWTIATPFSLGHPSLPQTSSREYRMPTATRGSTTADSAISCTTSCTGWTFLSGCSTSCVQWSIDVCSTKHRSTWRTAASTPQSELLVGSSCGPPAATGCSYLDTGVRCSVVGPFPWPVGRPATHYKNTWQFSTGSENSSFLRFASVGLYSA